MVIHARLAGPFVFREVCSRWLVQLLCQNCHTDEVQFSSALGSPRFGQKECLAVLEARLESPEHVFEDAIAGTGLRLERNSMFQGAAHNPRPTNTGPA